MDVDEPIASQVQPKDKHRLSFGSPHNGLPMCCYKETECAPSHSRSYHLISGLGTRKITLSDEKNVLIPFSEYRYIIPPGGV